MPNPATPVLIALIVILAVREAYIFWYLPALSRKYSAKGDRKRAREILARVGKSQPFFSRNQRLTCAYNASILFAADKEYRKAAVGFTLLLKVLERDKGNLPALARAVPGLEADLHQRLADCLEAQGLADEAASHRALAGAAIQQTPDNVLALLTRGRLLEREGRYPEAREAFEAALNSNPPPNAAARIEVLLKLTTCCVNTNDPAAVVRYSEEALKLHPKGMFLRVAYQMAAVGYGRTGNIAEAEAMSRKGYDTAVSQGNPQAAAESLSYLAFLLLRQGRIDECIATAQESAGQRGHHVRSALLAEASAHQVMGRFSDARRALEQARDAEGLFVPAIERRSLAVLCLARTDLELEDSRIDEATRQLDLATRAVGQEDLLGVHCIGLAARLAAARGDSQGARDLVDEVDAQMDKLVDDPESEKDIRSHIGMAACAIGDYERGLTCWERYWDLKPDIPRRPKVLYFIGECRWALGDLTAARQAYRESAGSLLSTDYVRRATARLAEIGPEA